MPEIDSRYSPRAMPAAIGLKLRAPESRAIQFSGSEVIKKREFTAEAQSTQRLRREIHCLKLCAPSPASAPLR